MKKFIAIMALIAIGFGAEAQTVWTNLIGSATKTKLSGIDTSYISWTNSLPFYSTFNIKTVQVADSFSGVATLQASFDGWTWQTLTGETTVCTSCLGASKTYTLQRGTTINTWNIGLTTFPKYRIKIYSTRTTDTTNVYGYQELGK